ncbi:MAG: hypothetical protein HC813_02860 [Planctomycetes bacterium]|nr:hypothetical protein [Planctomycetota bacterium]
MPYTGGMRKTMTALALLAAFSMPALAEGWKKLEGQRVPEFTAKTWLNTGKEEPNAALLRGKVYILEFFATW